MQNISHIIQSFMQVAIKTTRKFATLAQLLLLRVFTRNL